MEDKKGRQPETAADKKIKSDFGVKIDDLMKKREIKPSKLPEKLEEVGVEVSLATTKKWRSGAAVPGKPSDLVALAELLDCDIDFLFGKSENVSGDRESASEYTRMSAEAVEAIRYISPDQRNALESLIVAGAVLSVERQGERSSVSVLPPEPSIGSAVSLRETFLQELAGAMEERDGIIYQVEKLENALACYEKSVPGADVNARNEAQLLRIRIEKQAAERAKLLRSFSEYIDALFPEVSEDQEILRKAEAILPKLGSAPPVEFLD